MLLPRLPFLWWVGRVPPKLPMDPDPPPGVSLPSDDPNLFVFFVMPWPLFAIDAVVVDGVVDVWGDGNPL